MLTCAAWIAWIVITGPHTSFSSPNRPWTMRWHTGIIPADLPFIKQQGMAVLSEVYSTTQESKVAASVVGDFYRQNHPDIYKARQADVGAAVAGIQKLVDTTQFPDMKANWDTHPNNVGHKNSPGCFRCHDGKHVSQDNQAIRFECNLCHTVPQVGSPGQAITELPITKGKEPDSHKSTTWLSEHRSQFDASCATCHTTDNPGGSDNTSFCSNSACHATNWKYAGLNAPAGPRVRARPSRVIHPTSRTRSPTVPTARYATARARCGLGRLTMHPTLRICASSAISRL